MRLFIGIDLPREVKGNLSRLVDKLRPGAPQLKWSPAKNLHITTKFLGEFPDEQVEELTNVLGTLVSREPFEVAVRGLGWFPNPHNPRVLWAAVHASGALASLAKDTEQLVKPLGVNLRMSTEQTTYSPHLTLARIKPPANLAPLRQAIAALPGDEFGAFTVKSFHLFLSEPGQDNSIYTSLSEFPLEHP